MTPHDPREVRQSTLAGTWFPGDAGVLRRTVDELVGSVPVAAPPDRPIGLVCPHAGYTYSGATAATAYAAIRGRRFGRIVLLGPLHRPVASSAEPVVVPRESAYRTPLGDVAVDQPFLADLAREIDLTVVGGDREHSIEIQLPFLQVCLGDFSIAPLMLGLDVTRAVNRAALEELAGAIAARHDDATLLVVSTDLSHMHDHLAVVRIDHHLMELLASGEPYLVLHALARGEAHACGGAGLVAAMLVAQQVGKGTADVLAYSTSGDVTGDTRPGTYTVGYLAAVLA